MASYSLADGHFVSAEQTEFIYVSDGFAASAHETLWSVIGGENNLVVRRGAETKGYFPFNYMSDFVIAAKTFARDATELLYVYGVSNDIYAVGRDMVAVRYNVDFGPNGAAPEVYASEESINNFYDSHEVAAKIDNLNATDCFVTFSYMVFGPTMTEGAPLNSMCNWVVYDKRKQLSFNIKGGYYLFPVSEVSAEGEFVSLVHPVDIFSRKTALDLPVVDKYISAHAIDEESNPLLIFWKINPDK